MLTGRLLSLVSLPTHPALILMLIMAALPTSIYWISLFPGLKAPFSWELPVHTELAFSTWMYRENWIQCQNYSYKNCSVAPDAKIIVQNHMDHLHCGANRSHAKHSTGASQSDSLLTKQILHQQNKDKSPTKVFVFVSFHYCVVVVTLLTKNTAMVNILTETSGSDRVRFTDGDYVIM